MAESSKRDVWVDRIAAWERSGLSRRVWCGEHGVKVHTLDYWRRRLRGESVSARRKHPARAQLLPIQVALPAPAVPIEVLLPSGIRLRVPVGADAAQVAQWVQALAAC